MEIILIFVVFFYANWVLAESNLKIPAKIVCVTLAVSLYLLTMYIGSIAGTSAVTTRTDVLTYKTTTYAVPKTVVETTYTAPFWSFQSDTAYKVVGE
jgi:hypothetical protein